MSKPWVFQMRGWVNWPEQMKTRCARRDTSWTFAPISDALTPAPPNLQPAHPIFIQAMTRPRLLHNKPVRAGSAPEGRHSGRRAEPPVRALSLIIAAHAAYALADADIESIMVNCNPETVSTDYDTSDRLYFEPLTQENVLELLECEMASGELLGVIVQFGGQTPLKLSQALSAGIPILGTSPDAIDLAEDRDRFKDLLDDLANNPPMALPAAPMKPTPLLPISAFPSSFGRLTCWADVRWKLSPATPSLTAICAKR